MRISDWSSDVCSSDLDPYLDLVLHFPEHSVRGALRCRISRICACNQLKNCVRIGQAARHRPHMIEALDQREHAMSTNASPGGQDAGHAIERRRQDRKRVVWEKRESVRVELAGGR